MMAPIRIFIVSDSLTFCDDLKNLPLNGTEVEFIGEGKDINQAIDQIQRLSPDIVICGDRGMGGDSLGSAIHLLRVRSGIKIIGLNLQNNEITTYQSTHKIARDIQDLIEVIKPDFFPANEATSKRKNYTGRAVERNKPEYVKPHFRPETG